MGRKRDTWRSFPRMGIRSYLEACGVAFVAVAAGLVTVGGAIGTVVILAWKYTRGRRE